ncbi:3-keto-5-aminohexanoate cleavage protein [Streptomyces sp. NPDC093600]|uniref:3-keto-5-aminohexanoate cleavage protein n=1 Tax=Streptomyces sp. NPDC093600 TaxID=3366047 RepID=UPI00380BD2BB
MIQVCLNGGRGPGDSAAVPMSSAALAEEAAAAVAAGAGDVHVHPKTPCGGDTLSPRVLAETLTAIRAVVDVPVGVTTGAWAEPDPVRRVERVRSWTVLPDHASVNWHERGAEELAAALLERGVGVEAGLWSGTEGPARFLRSPLAPRVLRILAEVTDLDPTTAEATAHALLAQLAALGPDSSRLAERDSAHGRLTAPGHAPAPVLLHGEDAGAWPVLRLARRLGLATRVGLEDTLFLPDGRPARSNAELVAAAVTATERSL